MFCNLLFWVVVLGQSVHGLFHDWSETYADKLALIVVFNKRSILADEKRLFYIDVGEIERFLVVGIIDVVKVMVIERGHFGSRHVFELWLWEYDVVRGGTVVNVVADIVVADIWVIVVTVTDIVIVIVAVIVVVGIVVTDIVVAVINKFMKVDVCATWIFMIELHWRVFIFFNEYFQQIIYIIIKKNTFFLKELLQSLTLELLSL